MGACCSSSADHDPFATPGRVVGGPAPPQQPTTAPVPAGRIIGGGGIRRVFGYGEGSSNNAEPGAADEARRKAAQAAEARAAAASKPTGKLGAQLQAQKKQTRSETLQVASRDELRARDADENAQARLHN